jgi:Protein of unknown function (DUF1573)/Abnormal spindle-like microcephaly-assoc'd, ASPM-SPD-2-Hydin
VHQSFPRVLAHATLLLLLALTFAGAASAQSNYPGYVQIWDTKTNTQVPASGDNLGQGFVGGDNQRVFWFADLQNVNLDVSDCSITAPWTTGGLPLQGQSETIFPGLHNGFTIDLSSPQYGNYGATVSCAGFGGFHFPLSWQLLNPAATITVAAGATGLAPGASFNFPATLAGTTSNQVFTITNFGNTALIVSGAAISGTGFSTTQPLQSIPAGTSSSFTVTFSPTSGVPYSGVLTISSNDSVGNGSFKINLAGSGIAAAPTIQITDSSNGGASVNPGSTVSYGSPAAGTAVAHNFHITNNGNVALSISNPSTIVSGTGYSLPTPPPSSIGPNGGTGNFTVSFVESNSGTFPGQVSILSNASPSPFTFYTTAMVPSSPSGLIVRGPNGGYIPNGSGYGAGGVVIGQPVFLNFQFTNQSTTSNLTLSPLTVTGSSEFFVYSSNYGSIGPNSTVQEVLEFNPTSTSTVSSTLSFTAGGTPWTITLSGYGITPQPAMAVSWAATGAAIQNGQTYGFNGTTAGTPVSELFNITNNGTASLMLNSVSVTSPGGCFFLILSPTSPVNANGGSTSGRIRLYATTPESCTGTVTITSNDPTHPTFTFYLQGTISPVPYSLSIVAGDGTSIPPGGSYSGFPATTANVAVSRAFTITNSGAATISITNANSILTTSGGFYVTIAPPSSIAGAGGTGIFRIRLLASSPGTYTGTVTINGDPAGPYTFTISGTVN